MKRLQFINDCTCIHRDRTERYRRGELNTRPEGVIADIESKSGIHKAARDKWIKVCW